MSYVNRITGALYKMVVLSNSLANQIELYEDRSVMLTGQQKLNNFIAIVE